LGVRFRAGFGRESESAKKTIGSGAISLLIGWNPACDAPRVVARFLSYR